MATRSDEPSRRQRGGPVRTRIDGATSYILFNDEQLVIERDRCQEQADELRRHPGRSPAVGQLLVSIEDEIDRMTDELLRRARSRHPSSRRLSSRLRFRSLPWPPSAE